MMHALALAAAMSCGTERWSVKTLSDPAAAVVFQHSASIKETTVHALRSLPVPAHYDGDAPTRYPAEEQVVQLKVEYLGFKEEADRDLHIVVATPGDKTETMVVESPDTAPPSCVASHNATFQAQIEAVRRALGACFGPAASGHRMRYFKAPVSGEIRGVPFFDKLHGQTGVAPNGVELHPLLWVQADICPHDPM